MWKSDLKEVGERLIMWGRSMAQCSVLHSLSLSLSLRLPLSFSNTSLMGFWGKQRSFIHLSPSLTCSPPSCPSFFISLAAFLSFSILLLSLPAPWLLCSKAKMGLQSVALEPLSCSEWPCQYAHLIYYLNNQMLYSVLSNERSSATVMPRCICWLPLPLACVTNATMTMMQLVVTHWRLVMRWV